MLKYALASTALLTLTGLAAAGTDGLVHTESGVPLKVVVRSDTAVYETPTKEGANRPVQAFEFYYVLIPEEGSNEKKKDDFYRVASGPSSTLEVGWIHQDDVVEWAHRQALGLKPRKDRQPALFFRSDEELRSAYAPGADAVPLSREPEGGTTDINLVPILERFEMTADGDQVDAYRVAYLHATGTAQEKVDLDQATLDVVFVIDTTLSMEPHINATKQAVESIAKKLSEQVDNAEVRFGLVAYRDVIADAPDGWYVAEVFCDLDKGADHDDFQAVLGELHQAKTSSEDNAEDVLAGLKKAVKEVAWNPNAFKHIILMGDAPAQLGTTGPKNVEKLTIDALLALAQPRGRENVKEQITVHSIHCFDAAPDPDAVREFGEIAAGDQYPGKMASFDTTGSPGFIEELVLDIQGALSHVKSTGSTKGLSNDTPGLGLLMEMVQASEGVKGVVPTFANGYCCEIDVEGNQVFEPYILVQYGRLDMFVTFLDLSVKSLKNAGDPGSKNVERVVQSLQIIATQVSLGEDITPDMSVKKMAEVILGFPVRSSIFDMTFSKLAAMSEADFESWVKEIESSKAIAQGHLENTKIWRAYGSDVKKEHKHCFLKVSDIP